jgi:DNA-binding NarL/FixJ family response regulator
MGKAPVSEVRILIADDHEVVRHGLALLLNLEPGFRVVGEAQTGAQAIAEVGRLRPDIAILDLKMPEMDGGAAATQIKQHFPDTRVVILSGAEINDEVFDALEKGADGYLSKEVGPDELIRAIRAVAEGRRYIHPAVTQALLERRDARPAPPPLLSPRELEVLRLLATTDTYREIAQKLFISEETARSHVKSILAKLGQPNQKQAVLAAVRRGLIRLG